MSKDNQLAVQSNDFRKFLESGKSAIRNALPKHLNPERMLRLGLTAFSTTPALRECDPRTILASLVVASQLGLEPGVNGQGYLIPYGRNCTFVPGWRGLVQIANNSGRVSVSTQAVFEGDDFVINFGTRPDIQHVPGTQSGDPARITWAYACGWVKGADMPVIEAWRAARIWAHRDRFNKVGKRHYSFEHPEMYARKVVLLQVLKYMPASIELQNAIVAADAAESGFGSKVEEGVVIIDTDTEVATEGNVGNSALEDARRPGNPGATTGNAGAEERKEEGSGGGPSLAANRAEIKARLKGLNIGVSRFCKALEENEIIPRVVPFDDLDNGLLQTVIDGWEEIAPKLPPQ